MSGRHGKETSKHMSSHTETPTGSIRHSRWRSIRTTIVVTCSRRHWRSDAWPKRIIGEEVRQRKQQWRNCELRTHGELSCTAWRTKIEPYNRVIVTSAFFLDLTSLSLICSALYLFSTSAGALLCLSSLARWTAWTWRWWSRETHARRQVLVWMKGQFGPLNMCSGIRRVADWTCVQ